ncbi:hypothetical protein CCS01_15590 [Rhodopila globiformis]|uniref:Uncharacterized protein n=2 Tax=Rhodopila globiformis TaxID=1071 RepID=A0A2S6NDG6_RHOGL|nr:hypothetical protein CCS01_15590 [Rhodopila globiformis]
MEPGRRRSQAGNGDQPPRRAACGNAGGPLMPVSVLEKLSFLDACLALVATGRLAVGGPLAGSLADGVRMALFAMARRRPCPAN